MKLVIDTQIAENYAAHNGFGGKYRWKFKGGNTYVVEDITAAQQARIERDGIPTLTSLIEENNDYYRECVISARVVADDAAEGEEWETPFRLTYVNGKWGAHRTIMNDEYGYMRREIKAKTESYIMGEAGQRLEYSESYILRNGRMANDQEELQCELEMMEDAN